MKLYTWDSNKNEKLKNERHVCFEDVIYFLENGGHESTVEHPNQEKYKGQKMYIIIMRDYAYLVPFVETEDEIHLITIIPSRKTTKQYRKDAGNE